MYETISGYSGLMLWIYFLQMHICKMFAVDSLYDKKNIKRSLEHNIVQNSKTKSASIFWKCVSPFTSFGYDGIIIAAITQIVITFLILLCNSNSLIARKIYFECFPLLVANESNQTLQFIKWAQTLSCRLHVVHTKGEHHIPLL